MERIGSLSLYLTHTDGVFVYCILFVYDALFNVTVVVILVIIVFTDGDLICILSIIYI